MKTVIGIESVQYTNSQGKEVSGTRYYIGDDSSQHVSGLKVDSEFVSSKREDGSFLRLGDEFHRFHYEKAYGQYYCTGLD